jgi:hypothetical protein
LIRKQIAPIYYRDVKSGDILTFKDDVFALKENAHLNGRAVRVLEVRKVGRYYIKIQGVRGTFNFGNFWRYLPEVDKLLDVHVSIYEVVI